LDHGAEEVSLEIGSRIGPYEITSALGAGGMGEVYRARATKLQRDVAIKVLLLAVANDPDRLARFSREAQVLASLNHPNIAHIHGLEESNGVTALVMELVEGEDLSQRIARGPIPLDEALPIARQIAEALEAAHEQGIIHRDLKPANVKVRPDGTVKVLDFGLAKAIDPNAASNVSAMNSPTLSIHATEAGIILGTAAYMSPEQAAGKTVDKRTDLWAFGVVLFEMLTGRQVFAGETVSHVLAAVLKDEPAWATLPADTPQPIRRLLRRALEKDRKRRFTDASSARLDIDDALGGAPSFDATAPPVQFRQGVARERVLVASTLMFLLTTIGSIAWILRPAPTPAVLRFSVAAPEGMRIATYALSPDGRSLAFAAVASNGRRGLYVRPLDSTSAQPLSGTEDARAPFWSPDSRSIGFFAHSKLKTVEVSRGTVRTLCDAAGTRSFGDWSVEGIILFSTEQTDPIQRVSAAGGTPEPVTKVGQRGHTHPSFLPDGRRFLYYQGPLAGNGEVRLASLDSTEDTLILNESGLARYTEPGYLVFIRGADVMAQRFDPLRRVLSGQAFSIGTVGSSFDSNNPNASGFSVKSDGLFAFRGFEPEARELVWFERSGKRLSTVGDPGIYGNVQFSPDGLRLAFQQTDVQAERTDVWVLDLARGLRTRLTVGAHKSNFVPVWSPNGSSIALKADGMPFLWPTAGGTGEQLSSVSFDPNSFTPDGRFIVYTTLNPQTNRDIGILPLFGDRKPSLFLQTVANETHGQISPDGTRIAYESTESGTPEIFVQSFPEGGQKIRASMAGGVQPRWRRDGRELFYLSPDNHLMAVPVQTMPDFQLGTPSALFQTRADFGGGIGTNAHYDVTADGKRFIIASRISGNDNPPVTVVVNWTALSATQP
jgi:Tol biopolymer transport system component/tRNA A-37 threonylcarbamoyl transferase component Bud32